jgi:anti-anti-sigma factor
LAGVNTRADPPAWLTTLSITPAEIVLELGGELDLYAAGEIADTLEQLLAQPRASLIFELSQLRFIDSSGIALLIATAQRVERIELRSPTDIVRRVIELGGLSETLPITA